VKVAIAAPTIARATMRPRQSVKSRICPAMIGATTGARPVIIASCENARAVARAWKTSRTIARAMTQTAPPATPCRKRPRTSSEMSGANAHRTVVTTYTTRPVVTGMRRP